MASDGDRHGVHHGFGAEGLTAALYRCNMSTRFRELTGYIPGKLWTRALCPPLDGVHMARTFDNSGLVFSKSRVMSGQKSLDLTSFPYRARSVCGDGQATT